MSISKNEFKALILGTCTWDHVLAHPNLPSIKGGKNTEGFRYEAAGGAAPNTRLALEAIARAYGYDPNIIICTKLGKDGPQNPCKERVLEALGNSGMDDPRITDIAFDQDFRVSENYVTIWGQDFGKTERFASKSHDDIYTPFSETIDDEIVEKTDGCDIVIVNSRYPIHVEVAQLAAAERGIPVLLDYSEGNSTKDGLREMIERADYVVAPSDAALPALQGDGMSRLAKEWTRKAVEPASAFFPSLKSSWMRHELVQTYGAKYVGVSDNNSPVKIYSDGKYLQIPTERVMNVDNLGAGDVRDAMLGFFIARGDDFPLAMQKAMAIASFSVQYIGRGWIQELPAMLKKHPLFKADFAQAPATRFEPAAA